MKNRRSYLGRSDTDPDNSNNLSPGETGYFNGDILT